MIRHREGQPGDDHVRKRFPRNIDPHPETVRSEKYTTGSGFELLEQPSTRRARPLHEKIHFIFDEERLHPRRNLLHPAVTSEENECATSRLSNEMSNPSRERFFVACIARIRHFLHDEHFHLHTKIE